jgi:hypothetical protein
MASMDNSRNSLNDYRIEVSGWGLDSTFFVERTDLLWTPSGEKKVQLRRALMEGAIVFIRLLASDSSTSSVPVPYQVEGIEPMDCNGRCQMKLKQMHRRSKESLTAENASNVSEKSPRTCEQAEKEKGLQPEEVLQ